jgi:glycosyltransferase involved in cell wall biosynthesis
MLKRIACSVLICTYNRAALLQNTLESLCRQTLNADEFEVIVLDDGSGDETRNIATAFESRLTLRYAYQSNSGLASARNHALLLSQGEIVLLLDDDAIASPELLEEHGKTHRMYPQDNFAVLGYTSLAPELAADPVMHFATEVGRFLFSYLDIQHGQVLGFSNFCGGRSSCKRKFLLQHGIFNPVFRFGCEDIELAYRLTKHNLRVVYNAHGVTTMVRPYSFDQFCERLIKQGRSNFVFSQLHSDPEVQAWTEVDDIRKWGLLGPVYETFRKSGRELDAVVRYKQQIEMVTEQDLRVLHEAFWVAFRASKIKGMAEAAMECHQLDP